jgi:NOL1/NOP2/fmu family ribosome biogenesis protein
VFLRALGVASTFSQRAASSITFDATQSRSWVAGRAIEQNLPSVVRWRGIVASVEPRATH